jgi:hypothetical protein
MENLKRMRDLRDLRDLRVVRDPSFSPINKESFA